VRFHISDVLSITHGRLVSTRHMDGIYDICNFLTGDNIFTHQLPRVISECKGWLLTLHPALHELPLVTDEEILAMKLVSGKPAEWWRLWVQAQIEHFGEYLDVEPMPKDIHEFKDPIAEAVEMVGKDRVIVAKERK